MLPKLRAAFAAASTAPAANAPSAAGATSTWGVGDQFLLTVVWLRHYPTQECLGYLFGVSDSTAKRAFDRCLPLLERSGRDTLRLPDPGRGRHRDLPALLKDTPGLAVLVDTFEQPTQRPHRQQWAYYSGQKKAHTHKSQVDVDEDGRAIYVAQSRPGRWADLKVCKRSGLVGRLVRAGVWALGKPGYVGIDDVHPRLAPRGQDRPPEDRRYNRAFARRRSGVEHAIGRPRHYQALSQVDGHRRRGHTTRVRAVAWLVNRMRDHRRDS